MEQKLKIGLISTLVCYSLIHVGGEHLSLPMIIWHILSIVTLPKVFMSNPINWTELIALVPLISFIHLIVATIRLNSKTNKIWLFVSIVTLIITVSYFGSNVLNSIRWREKYYFLIPAFLFAIFSIISLIPILRFNKE